MPSSACRRLQLAAHAQAQELVERRQRLVEQQDARVGDQRARASATRCCCPPDSCAGRRSRRWSSCTRSSIARACRRRSSLRRRRASSDRTRRCRGRSDAGTAHSSGTSSPCRAAPAAGRRPTRRRCGSRRGRRLVARDHAQDRGLAAARRPEQAAIGAFGNGQVDVLYRCPVAKHLVTATSSISPAPPDASSRHP